MNAIMSSVTTWDSFIGKKKPCDNELNEARPCVSIINPCDPLKEYNFAYRSGWSANVVSGLELLDSGSTRNIRVAVDVCTCVRCGVCTGEYDALDAKREIKEISTCSVCYDEETMPDLCGEVCLDDFTVPDKRYCILRIRDCGVVRDIPVQRIGDIETTRRGKCTRYEMVFEAQADFNFPRMQTVICDGLTQDDLICADVLCDTGGSVDLTKIDSFEKCINVPYAGDVRGYPEIIIRGDVTNLAIRNTTTDACIDFNNRDGAYTISGCAPHKLNFMRNQQSYLNGVGQSVYQDLRLGCGSFYLEPKCPTGTELCISGDLVDPENFYFEVRWWDAFRDFDRAQNEPMFSDLFGADDGCNK